LEMTNSTSKTASVNYFCDICLKELRKYRCPKCSYRTCSLICSKLHKEKLNQQSSDLCYTPVQRYLLNNARRRRIWLTITANKESRHEQFSDTIFWSILLIFRREINKDGEKGVVDYNFSVNNIPESISLKTLIRQFIKPKKIGPVVNKDELDEEKLLPFQDAGMDRLMIYMPVPISILDNLRNRFIIDHPTFIITLDDQFNDYVMLSEQESQEMREKQRQQERNNDFNRGRFGHVSSVFCIASKIFCLIISFSYFFIYPLIPLFFQFFGGRRGFRNGCKAQGNKGKAISHESGRKRFHEDENLHQNRNSWKRNRRIDRRTESGKYYGHGW
uniref:HIT-type domain-containing protein n=1 Tax=Dracunculus medinensis TaxID=318479 RepID=A0A158Q376_DRAME